MSNGWKGIAYVIQGKYWAISWIKVLIRDTRDLIINPHEGIKHEGIEGELSPGTEASLILGRYFKGRTNHLSIDGHGNRFVVRV